MPGGQGGHRRGVTATANSATVAMGGSGIYAWVNRELIHDGHDGGLRLLVLLSQGINHDFVHGGSLGVLGQGIIMNLSMTEASGLSMTDEVAELLAPELLPLLLVELVNNVSTKSPPTSLSTMDRGLAGAR